MSKVPRELSKVPRAHAYELRAALPSFFGQLIAVVCASLGGEG